MTTSTAPERLRPPVPPAAGPRASFPLIAALAPVLSALVLFALTSSPYTLALAALGPIVAVASYLDARRVRRRTARVERERYARELADYEAAVAREAEERATAVRRAAPTALDILTGDVAVDAHWRREPDDLSLVLGHPIGASSSAAAATAPLLVAPAIGIGVVGPPVLTRAFVRGLILQCAELAAPDALALDLPEATAWDCLRPLPHVRSSAATSRLRIVEHPTAVPPGAAFLLALAEDAADIPPTCRCVVQLGASGGHTVVGRTGPGSSEALAVEFVSQEQSRRYASGLATSSGTGGRPALPAKALLADLGALGRIGGEPGLPAILGTTASGPFEVDLVRDGPHAIVGGTTGSGKSELLIAWILALASRHGPSGVTFLLADFKGGAGFGALAALPHVTGVITDLDQEGAARAFASIAAELRRRETLLAERSVPDIARLEPGLLARLVIVVDECAVVLERAPELHRTFADIAARGRSLGIHLVLCTQRPVGVVRDAVVANCGLRIALRVHDAVDSRTLIGSDEAARIPHGAAGRCVVSIGGRTRSVQAALARPEDVASAASPSDCSTPVHRPWLDPLPQRIPLPPTTAGRLLLGVVDRPALQRQDRLEWDRRSLLVLGAAGSGRSGVLATLRAQCPGARIVSPVDPEEAWDAISRHDPSTAILLVDDLDLLLRRCSDDERRRLLDALQTSLRSGEHRIVVSARRTTDGVATVRDAFDDVLLLRAANRQEHQLHALESEPFHSDLPPGGGWWRGERLQVFEAPATRPRARRRQVRTVEFERALAVLTNRPDALGSRLADLGVAVVRPGDVPAPPSGRCAVVGSVALWSTARALLDDLRRGAPVVVDIAPGEARVLLGPLEPAPLCVGDRVLLARDGRLERARWPTPEELKQEESAV